MCRILKSFLFIVFLLHGKIELKAQNHVTWKATWDKNSNALVIKGNIDPSWHLYSPKTDPNLGPIALGVTFEKIKGIKKIGGLEFLTPPIAYQDDNFGGMVYIWENEIEIHQAFRIKKSGVLKLTLNYMICDETKCIPPIDVPINIQINN
ncbi:MAG: protein-disulfide reductase DsbD domain-containing protein [Flavobacteriales bacterium]